MSYKSIVLVCLVVQNSLLALTMRLSRMNPTSSLYLPCSAVFIAEVAKFVICWFFLFQENRSNTWKVTVNEIFGKPLELLKLFIPSSIYVLQNNLGYFAVSNLDTPTYQLISQSKILTTALFSVLILHKRLISVQWISLFILITGVCLVQLSQIKTDDQVKSRNSFFGFLAVVLACFSSGFAGVYFEKILKGSSTSIWVRNIHLSGIGIVFSLSGILIYENQFVQEKGIFFGYNLIVWIVIILQTSGGILVALVVKYADNVLKAFATSISVAFTSIISIYLFDFKVTFNFLVGAILVLVSVFLYTNPNYDLFASFKSQDVNNSEKDKIEKDFC